MEQDTLRRRLVESVVERSLRGIRTDPERSLRKLVDLGTTWPRDRASSSFLPRYSAFWPGRAVPTTVWPRIWPPRWTRPGSRPLGSIWAGTG